MSQAHQEQVGHRLLTTDDASHQEDGQLFVSSQVQCGAVVLPESWAVWWYHDHTEFQLELWMMDDEPSAWEGFFFFLPACFNSVWLQVPNIAQAFTSDVMVDCLSTNRYEVIGCPVVWRTARWRWCPKSVENLKPLMSEFLAFFWGDDHRLLFNLAFVVSSF